MHIGLLCAMPEEIGATIENLHNVSNTSFGDLQIISGEWYLSVSNHPSVYISVAWSGWGKVSAARAATRLIASSFYGKSIDVLFFTGVAGSAKSELSQWDVVIPSELIQHDMDARPLFQKYVIPALRREKIQSNKQWVDWACSTIREAITNDLLDNFGKVETGLIATGDIFIDEKSLLDNLSRDLPGLSAVEMEGAAVAQVACQERVPWLIIRVISDSADDLAAQTFQDFLKEYKRCSWSLIETLLKNHVKAPWQNS